MENQEQEKSILEKLQGKLEILAKITPESLVRTDVLGKAFDFRDGVETFNRTLKLFRDLKGANLDDFPDPALNTLLSHTNSATEIFEKIKTFQPGEEDNPGDVRDKLIQQIDNSYPSQHSHIYPILAYSFGKGTDFESLVGEAKIAVSKSDEEFKKAENASKQIEEILKAARKAAGEIGVTKYAEIFKKEADSYKIKGRWWLGTTAIIAGITLFIGFKNVKYYIDVIKDMDTPQAIQVGLSKLVIFAVLYFGLVWVGKIYKAQQHNYVVNQHRNNALKTFTTFVKAAEGDDQTKSAILIQTTQAIFSPQHSGFTAQEKEFSPSPQILEILRNIVGERK